MAGAIAAALSSGSSQALAGGAGGRAVDHSAVPGDASRGVELFVEKGCAGCHLATSVAPRLSGHDEPWTAADIAVAMWNHAPAMWKTMEAAGTVDIAFTDEEMSDLFAYIYFLDLLEPRGDADRGQVLFAKKRCSTCHGYDNERGAPIAPTVEFWSAHVDSSRFAQRMWNHAEQMLTQLSIQSIDWPKLSETDIADIIAYVWATNTVAEKRYTKPANAVRGADLFDDKGCATCHSAGGDDDAIGPDLTALETPRARTVTAMAARMWNHYPDMKKQLRRTGATSMPSFGEGEMADVIAYLFSVGYFDADGDAARGRKLFRRKRCGHCHRKGTEAPALSEIKGTASAVTMARAMWNHGRKMVRSMKNEQVEWPQLTRTQMLDLLAYLGPNAD